VGLGRRHHCAIDLKLLASGNPILSNEQNEIIFKQVFEYYKEVWKDSCLNGSPNEQPHTPSPPTSLSLSHSFLRSLFLLNLHILM
jgi:hypothetical protein